MKSHSLFFVIFDSSCKLSPDFKSEHQTLKLFKKEDFHRKFAEKR